MAVVSWVRSLRDGCLRPSDGGAPACLLTAAFLVAAACAPCGAPLIAAASAGSLFAAALRSGGLDSCPSCLGPPKAGHQRNPARPSARCPLTRRTRFGPARHPAVRAGP